MATSVLLVIIGIGIAAALLWRRWYQSDTRSLAAYHTMMDRLQHLDGQSSTAPATDPATPHVRILRTVTPSSTPFGESDPNSSGRHGDAELQSAPPNKPIANGQATLTPGSGPTLVFVDDSVFEPIEHGSGTRHSCPADGSANGVRRPAPMTTQRRTSGGPQPMPKAPRRAPAAGVSPQPQPTPIPQTGWGPPAAPLARPVLFFDDYSPAAAGTAPPTPTNGATIPDPTRSRAHESAPRRVRSRRQLLRTATPTLAAAASLIALTAVSSVSGSSRPLASTVGHHPQRPSAPTGLPTPNTRAPGAQETPAVTPTATTVPAGLPTGKDSPQLTSISPGFGAPGQEVTLTGAGLFSPKGVIIVRFGAQEAPVVCPNQTTCQAIVPSLPGSGAPRSQPVTVSTQAGTDSAWDPRRLYTLEVRMEHGIVTPVTEAVSA